MHSGGLPMSAILSNRVFHEETHRLSESLALLMHPTQMHEKVSRNKSFQATIVFELTCKIAVHLNINGTAHLGLSSYQVSIARMVDMASGPPIPQTATGM